MSTALAIAGVTAVLRNLLDDGIVNVSSVLGSSVTVSISPPDRVVPQNSDESSQLNLFMYLVTANTGWSNEQLPSRDASGRLRLTNRPLALDLHYLLSVYSGGDLHGEILLGYAMQLLHETPVLTRDMIRTALTHTPVIGAGLTPALRALADSGLEDQVELIKLTPQYLNTEEMSKLWTAMQSNFRPTAAYIASVVLIEAQQPARSPLPVLTRGNSYTSLTGERRDRGIGVTPGLLPALPMLTVVTPPAHQPVAAIDDTIELGGHHLDGSGRAVLLTNDRFGIEVTLPALPPPSPPADPDKRMEFSLAGQDSTLPVGVYRIAARLVRPGESAPRETNRIAFTLAPRITNLPQTIKRDDVDGSASLTIEFTPTLRDGQQAVLVIDTTEYLPQNGPGSPPTGLSFDIPDAPIGTHLVRLRIDGIESPIIDLSAEKPASPTFLDRTVEFT